MISRQILGLQLVYTVHACLSRTHSRVAVSTYAYGALFNLEQAVYDTMLSDGKWDKVLTDELLPGDVASLGEWLYSLKEFLY